MIKLNPSHGAAKHRSSLDAYIEGVAIGDIQVFQITNNLHPGVCPGDILLIDQCEISECEDKTFLLIECSGKRILKQKHTIGAILRRSGIHAVGFERRDHIKFVGRVIGWLHR